MNDAGARTQGRTFPFQRPESGGVTFPGDGDLEGILEWPESGSVLGGIVVAHPHPLHGGTMAQPVVYRCAQAARGSGFASLRFNFRGVGRSAGAYSGSEEYRDVIAAASYLRGRLTALSAGRPEESHPLVLAGYSFGSVMSVVAAPVIQPDALVLIGFAVESELFPKAAIERLRGFPGPILAVSGEADDIASPDAVERTLREMGVTFRMSILRGTGHFFEGRQREVGETVATFISEVA